MPDSQDTPRAASLPFEVVEWRPASSATLRGYAAVRMPSGMVIAGVAIHRHDGGAWASPPSKPMVGRDGQQRTNDAGKGLWVPIVWFTDRTTQAAWSEAVLAPLQDAHPEAPA